MKLSFTKLPRHRTFTHTPIYYDQAKEDSKERERKAKEELGLLDEEAKSEGYSDRIKKGLRGQKKPQMEVGRSTRQKSNIRLVIILAILLILASYFMKSGHHWLGQFIGN